MDKEAVTLKQLQYFLAIDQTKSFRRAAEQCAISQPSLTVQIQNLEGILNVRLVERSRTGVVLTPIGREVAERARAILGEVRAIHDIVADAQKGITGTIRLGVKPTLGPYLLPHVIGKLHNLFPDLRLYVRESTPRELEEELYRGVHDLILAQLPIMNAELVTRRLFREPIHLALPVDHPLTRKQDILTTDLRGLQVLSLSPQYHLHDQISTLCKEFGATLLKDYEGTSLDTLRQMVGMGMGVTFLPELYIRSEVPSRSEIAIRSLKGRVITRSIGIVWRKSAGRARAFEEIAELIRKVAGSKFKTLLIEG